MKSGPYAVNVSSVRGPSAGGTVVTLTGYFGLSVASLTGVWVDGAAATVQSHVPFALDYASKSFTYGTVVFAVPASAAVAQAQAQGAPVVNVTEAAVTVPVMFAGETRNASLSFFYYPRTSVVQLCSLCL